MNNDLLINMYKLLKYYIKQNEEDLVTYNNMVANGDTYEERVEFCDKMKPAVDNFYALKPYYIKFRENPTEELEIEIMKKFGASLDEFKANGKVETSTADESQSKEMLEKLREKAEENDRKAKESIAAARAEGTESSEKEEPKKQPFPSLDGSTSKEMLEELRKKTEENDRKAKEKLAAARAEGTESSEKEKPAKQPFPSLDGSASKEMLEDLRRKTAEIEAAESAKANPLNDDTANLSFSKFNGNNNPSKPKARPFLSRLSSFGKEIVEGFKEGWALAKEEAAERRKAANVYYFPEENGLGSSKSLRIR